MLTNITDNFDNLHRFQVNNLILKLPGEGQMALPLNLNDTNIPNADSSLYFKFKHFFFDKV